MKTIVTMNSPDRNLFGVTIRHQTNGFLNLNDLQEAFTRLRIQEGLPEKRVDHILNYKDNHERIYFLLKEQGVIIPTVAGFMEEVENKGIVTTLKRYKQYKTTGARKTKAISCNPYIWTLVALEMSPQLYAKVVTWLADKLLINRIEAGNFYKALSSAITRFPHANYSLIAKALNYIVFNKHEPGIRNTGTQSQLKELEELERKMAFAIDMGYITSQSQLVNDLRKLYKQKWNYENTAIEVED
jgi:hypothetical protein